MKKVLAWELVGILFIVFVGSFFHFLFELSGYLKVVALIAAVNESVWEHLKLGVFPAAIYALIEYKFLKKPNFVTAKAVSIYVIPIAIVGLFYLYTAILGYDTLVMDILIFVIAVILGQLASYKLLMSSDLPQWWNKVSFVAIIVILVLFMVFTFYPPHLSLFQDPITGGYGIQPHS